MRFHSSSINKSIATFLCLVLLAFSLITTTSYKTDRADAAGLNCTWTGATSTSMNAASNWTGCSASIPGTNDALTFPSTATRLTAINDIAGSPRFASIVVSGTYTFSGSTLNLSGNFMVSGATQLNAANNIDFTGNAYMGFVFTGSALQIITVTGNVNASITGGYIFLNQGTVSTTEYLNLQGGVSGSVDNFRITDIDGFIVQAAHPVTIATTNGITVNNSNLTCYSDCFGDDTSDIALTGNVSITLGNSTEIANDIAGTTSTITFISYTGVNSINGSMNFQDSNVTFKVQDGVNNQLDIDGAIYSDSPLSFEGATSDSIDLSEGININGAMTGTGNISVNHTKLFVNGAFNQNSAIVTINPASAFIGTSSDAFPLDVSFVIQSGASLQIAGETTVNSDLTIEGTGIDIDGFRGAIVTPNTQDYVTINGDINLTGDATIRNDGDQSDKVVFVNSEISGTGDLTLRGSDNTGEGRFVINPDDGNGFNGDFIVAGGTAEFSVGFSVPNDLILQSSTVDNPTSAYLTGDDAVSGNIIVGTDTTLVVSSQQSLDSLTGDGTVGIGAGGELTIYNENDLVFDGTFKPDEDGSRGARDIIKAGAGTFTINGAINENSDYPLIFTVNEGDVKFASSTSNGIELVMNSGTIKGSGIFNNLTVNNGRVAPGNSPGCITSNGDMVLEADSFLDIELGGTTPCSGYDQLIGGSTIDLTISSLTLDLVNGFTPTVGDVFTIVRASEILGTFAGFGNGNVYTNSGVKYRINYNTNLNGEDSVTLTVVGDAVPSTGAIPGASKVGAGALPATGINNAYFLTVLGFSFLLLGFIFISKKRRKLL